MEGNNPLVPLTPSCEAALAIFSHQPPRVLAPTSASTVPEGPPAPLVPAGTQVPLWPAESQFPGVRNI